MENLSIITNVIDVSAVGMPRNYLPDYFKFCHDNNEY